MKGAIDCVGGKSKYRFPFGLPSLRQLVLEGPEGGGILFHQGCPQLCALSPLSRSMCGSLSSNLRKREEKRTKKALPFTGIPFCSHMPSGGLPLLLEPLGQVQDPVSYLSGPDMRNRLQALHHLTCQVHTGLRSNNLER